MVFAATRRRGTVALEGKTIGAAATASNAVRKGSLTREAASIAGPEFASPGRPLDANSIDASRSRKPASTASASASISVFLAARFLWTQSEASSADWSRPMSVNNCSRSAADWSGSRTVRAARMTFSFRLEVEYGRPFLDRFGRPQLRVYAALLCGARCVGSIALFAPSSRSGASRSSSPAMPTRVKRA